MSKKRILLSIILFVGGVYILYLGIYPKLMKIGMTNDFFYCLGIFLIWLGFAIHVLWQGKIKENKPGNQEEINK